jgi:hypothetical protein
MNIISINNKEGFTMKRQCIFWGTGLAVVLLVAACATQSTVRPVFSDEQRATAERLVTHWNEYDIYGYQWGGQVPAVLLFDVKNDNKRLRVDKNWVQFTSEEQLRTGIQRASLWKAQAIPRLSTIVGPDGTVWGYAITGYGQISASVADANTIDISPPRDPRPPQ